MHTKEKKTKMRHGKRNQYPGNGPYRDLPPHQRPGNLHGGGRGRGYRGTDPTKCARFPWLQRWWWTDPEKTSEGTLPAAPSSEKEFLETQLDYLAKEMEQVKSRIEELGTIETQ